MMQKYMAGAPIPASTVTAMKADYQQWQPQLDAVGTLRAVRGVDVTTEIAGLVRTREFQVRRRGRGGPACWRSSTPIPTSRSSTRSRRRPISRRRCTNATRPQLEAEAVSKAQVDADAADLKSKRAQVAQQAALVAKKTIRAPFAGKLGITHGEPGAVPQPGRQARHAADDRPDLRRLLPAAAAGAADRARAAGHAAPSTPSRTEFPGKINAINPKVDLDYAQRPGRSDDRQSEAAAAARHVRHR